MHCQCLKQLNDNHIKGSNKVNDMNNLEIKLKELVAIINEVTEGGKLTDDCGFDRQDYSTQLEQATESKGFTLLGSGHFSGAYSHPDIPGLVIKVGLKKEDSGAAYAAWCRANQGMAGVPVIHHIARHESCYTVVLDRLKPLYEYVDVDVYGGEIYKEGGAELFKAYKVVQQGVGNGIRLPTAQYEKLQGTSLAIHNFFNGIASFDLHSGNVMVDPKTKQLVITDPVSFTHDEDVKSQGVGLDVDAQARKAIREKAKHNLQFKTDELVTLWVPEEVEEWAFAYLDGTEERILRRNLVDKHINKMVIDLVADRKLDLDKRLEAQFLRG